MEQAFDINKQRILPGDIEVREETSSTVIPRFYIKPVQNNFKSAQAGRAMFDDVEYIEITIAGDKTSRLDRKVTDVERARFPKQYERFKAGITASHDGTSIEQWPQISRSQAEEMKHMGIHTVEALAELSDTAIQKLGMGYRSLSQRAKAFLDVANGTADTSKLIAENEALQSNVNNLTNQVQQLVEQNTKMAARLEALESVRTEPVQQTVAPSFEIPQENYTPEPEQENYAGMTKMQLQSILKQRGIEFKVRDDNATLIKLLEDADNGM